MASGKKTRVDASQLQFSRLLCRVFFQLLKHTESMTSCVARDNGGLQDVMATDLLVVLCVCPSSARY